MLPPLRKIPKTKSIMKQTNLARMRSLAWLREYYYQTTKDIINIICIVSKGLRKVWLHMTCPNKMIYWDSFYNR
jgi:hypothetical protein